MTKLIPLFFMCIALLDFACKQDEKNKNAVYFPPSVTHINDKPEVKVIIALKDSVFDEGADIPITISVLNDRGYTQKILFERRNFPSYGIWNTYVDIKNSQTGSSMIKHASLELLYSTILDPNDPLNGFHELAPGQSVSVNCGVSDLCALHSPNHYLPKGYFDIQITYKEIKSNSLRIRVK